MLTIETAEDAIERADQFLSKYYPFKQPLSVKKEEDTWLLEFNVGVLSIQKVQLRLRASSGSVIEYDDLRAR